MNEIGKERLDIISYSKDDAEYIKNALAPAKIEKILVNRKRRRAMAVVDDDHLSLTIGKEGVNVRLAARLTGWKIDIKSRSDYEKSLEENPNFEKDFENAEGFREPALFLEDLFEEGDLTDNSDDIIDEESISELFE